MRDPHTMSKSIFPILIILVVALSCKDIGADADSQLLDYRIAMGIVG
jgi:hypothetical protein